MEDENNNTFASTDDIRQAFNKVSDNYTYGLGNRIWLRTGYYKPNMRVPFLGFRIGNPEHTPYIRHAYGVAYRLPVYAEPTLAVDDIVVQRDYLAIKAFVYAMAILGGVTLGTMLLMELAR